MIVTRLNRVLISLVGTCLLLLALPVLAGAEEIAIFTSDISVLEDGSFTVTETIAYDFGDLQRHGIFRDILHSHPQEASKWYKERYLELEIVSVARNGKAEPFVVNSTEDNTNIKIGDPNITISGQHTYRIRYRVTGGLSYFDDGGAEIYWNATGNEWPVLVRQAVVNLTSPAGVLQSQKACYQGDYGANEACESMEETENGSVFMAGNLMPGEGLTVAQAVDANQVGTVIHEKIVLWFWFVFLALLLVTGAGYLLFRYETKYRPVNNTIITQYDPYPEILPMFAGVLIDGRLHPRDITAGILHLAQEGIISIKHTSEKVMWLFDVDDYEITMEKDIDLTDDSALPSKFHRTLLELFFTVTNKGVTVKLSDLKNNQSKQRKNYAAVSSLKSAVIKDLEKRGFFELFLMPKRLYVTGGSVATIIFLFAINVVPVLFLFLIPLAIVYFVIRNRRTKMGYEAMYHLKGFKDFLSVTGKDRFKFHNAPTKNPQQFLEYLPYAVAFGVEDEWAEAFKDITVPVPDWYRDSSGNAFSATVLTKNLSVFSTAMSTGVLGSRSSSSSGGSFGGGFSGGGGGGGGGGSW